MQNGYIYLFTLSFQFENNLSTRRLLRSGLFRKMRDFFGPCLIENSHKDSREAQADIIQFVSEISNSFTLQPVQTGFTLFRNKRFMHNEMTKSEML